MDSYVFVVVTMVVKTVLSPDDEEAVVANPMTAMFRLGLFWEALAQGDRSAAIESALCINAPQVSKESFPFNS